MAGDAPAGERGFRGYQVVRGERVLGAENAERRFVPGSVQKLLVAAAALHHLGPDHRIVTRLYGDGELVDGSLHGDLVVVAAADPTWNVRFHPGDARAPLRRLASALRRRGIRRVTGDLVIDTSRFPGRASAVTLPAAETALAFAAPTSALAVDESSVQVTVAPGREPGDPGRLSPGAGAELFEWVNRIRTVPRERHERGTVEFRPRWGERTVVVTGEYPVSEPTYTMAVSVPHPDLFAAEALRAVLAEEGVTVVGEVRIETTGLTAGLALAEIRSPPLAEILPRILRESRNWYAEMLLRQLAVEVRGQGYRDDGLDILAQFLVEEVGVATDAFALDDAAGLSPFNLLAPEAVTELLGWVLHQPWREAFLAALARPGTGTLRPWGTLPYMAAKTGSIRGTLALAGYLDLQAAEPVVFVCFLNHRDEDGSALRGEMKRWLEGWARRITASRATPRAGCRGRSGCLRPRSRPRPESGYPASRARR